MVIVDMPGGIILMIVYNSTSLTISIEDDSQRDERSRNTIVQK